MEVHNCTPADHGEIMRRYAAAADYQRQINATIIWPAFDPDMVSREIEEKHQWKMLDDGEIMCLWATTFSDEQIWEERNAEPALYIHRIATDPAARGKNMVKKLVDWAMPHARSLGKHYVRLDTLGDNKRLITHYEKAGFTFLGLFPMQDTSSLPDHYQNQPVCLFEIEL